MGRSYQTTTPGRGELLCMCECMHVVRACTHVHTHTHIHCAFSRVLRPQVGHYDRMFTITGLTVSKHTYQSVLQCLLAAVANSILSTLAWLTGLTVIGLFCSVCSHLYLFICLISPQDSHPPFDIHTYGSQIVEDLDQSMQQTGKLLQHVSGK